MMKKEVNMPDKFLPGDRVVLKQGKKLYPGKVAGYSEQSTIGTEVFVEVPVLLDHDQEFVAWCMDEDLELEKK